MDQEKIGKLIKNIRTSNNLTQQEFANKYGVTYQAVSKWENGKNMPDIELLKQISQDYNISIDELLGGSKKVSLINKKMVIMFIGILLVLGILFISFNGNSSFEFKTLSSTCDEFKISGSISYNDTKTSISILKINYCSGDDTNLYKNIECSLYEDNGIEENKISSCSYDKDENITLEKYLSEVEFAVDDYKTSCNVYSNETLYLRINATSKDGHDVSYKIPLKLTDTCNK